MSQGRKREINSGAGEPSTSSSPSKKYRPSPAPKVPLYWQWEGDKGAWTACASQLSSAINDSLDSDGQNVKFEAGGKMMEVRLDRMIQRNCTTGWERRLRCCVKQANQYYVWQWQDEKKKWNAYNPSETIALENGRQKKEDSISLIIAGRHYTMNLNDMEQHNDATEVVRKMDRLKTEYNPSSQSVKIIKSAEEEEEVATRSGRRTRKAVKVEKDVQEEEEEADEDKPSTSKAKPKTQSARWEQGVKTVRITGNRAPVDPECLQMVGKSQVYLEGAADMYDAMLNQTNLKNNNNKYYIIQLLEECNRKWYHVWFRWGRVGNKGQNNLVNCGTDLEQAKSLFQQKFWDKTKNEWAGRNNFVKVAGKYDLLTMDYSTEGGEKEAEEESTETKPKVASKLDKRVQDLVTLICNVKAMEDMVIEMKYDTQKAPLGKLTANQIKAGYLALKQIEACIEKKVIGDKLIQACDAFYTRIPHNFGMQRPPVIRTKQEFKAKMALLEALSDIQVAMTVLKSERDESEHPIDQQYHQLKCGMTPLEKTSEVFKMICRYVSQTHAKTHNQYSMVVEEVFDLDKDGEKNRFNDLGNRMLLWHGSRLTNWAGILGQGLRIAPPEAPVTGYMFGKGLYFADMSSKSANYCFATRTKPTGLLTLCEVSLGTENELLAADYQADALPAGKHSVKGLGRIAPDPKHNHVMDDGTVVPLGKGIDTKVVNPNGYTLNYNEFIVYNTNQVRMRYLVKLKFNFK